MTAAELIDLGRSRGVTVGARFAARLLEHDGQAAGELVEGAASLTDLASALGHDLDLLEAIDGLRAVGYDYDVARQQLVEHYRLGERRGQVFNREWARLERKLYSDDAKARHAVLTERLTGGTLGWQASMLLRAAEDARLTDPSAATFRRRLESIVTDGIARAYPVRREAQWQVVGEGSELHAQRVEGAMRDEQRVRDMVLARRPELSQRIDALPGSKTRGDVHKCLGQIRRALSGRAASGWVSDPERFEREVIAAARDAALRLAS